MSSPFLILALPRSRTAWLSNFLTYGNIRCQHEIVGKEGIDRLRPNLRNGTHQFHGNADTLAAVYLEQILDEIPDVRLVVVLRRPSQVIASLIAKGFKGSDYAISRLAPMIDRATQIEGALTVNFEDLSRESTLRALQEHVAPGEPFHRWRFHEQIRLNVQMDEQSLNEVKRLCGQIP